MKRRIIIASQNETVRSCPDDEVDLATIGLQGCVAVIIKDQNGNASLTHVDAETDLGFIKDEIKRMDGDFTIDIVRPEPPRGELQHKVRKAIVGFGYGDVKNSKGTLDIRKSTEGTVLLRKNALLIPKPIHIFEVMSHVPLSKDNALKGDKVECGFGDMQRRIYTRQLNCVFSEHPCSKPVVTFNESKWFDRQEVLDGKVQSFLDSLKSNSESELIDRCMKHKRITPLSLRSALHVVPRYKKLIEALHQHNESKKPSR